MKKWILWIVICIICIVILLCINKSMGQKYHVFFDAQITGSYCKTGYEPQVVQFWEMPF